MIIKRFLSVVVLSILLFGSHDAAIGDVIWTGDRAEWEMLAGDFTTIGFNELPPETWVTEQYAHLGVHFVDGADLLLYGPSTFPNDGFGIVGFEETHLVFDMPLTSIAIDFPGVAQFRLYSSGQQVYESLWFGGGGVGFFVGLISTEPFDEVIIIDPLDNVVYLDDLHFGPPIPAPPAMALLVLAAAQPGRRRRR